MQLPIHRKISGAFTWPLYLFSLLFAFGVFVHQISLRVRRKRVSSSFVISIGNIAVGGTGKTPFALFLTKELMKNGKKVAVLSRGYKSLSEHRKTPFLGCDGNGPLATYREMGDEPYLLAKRAPGIFLYTGKNRSLSSQSAEKKAPFLLLDDGFQYQMLKRDLEIVMLDPNAPLKGFLPFGFLRDFPYRLKEADLIAAKIEDRNQCLDLEAKIRTYTKAPLIGLKPIYTLKNREGTKVKNPEKAALFCGIAKPEKFLQEVQRRGIQIVSAYFAPDHGEVPIQKFSEDSLKKGAKYLLCTEKDAVKLEQVRTSLPLLYLEMDLQIIYGEKEWGKIIEKILDKGDNFPYEN